jgi:hypothetical protein
MVLVLDTTKPIINIFLDNIINKKMILKMVLDFQKNKLPKLENNFIFAQ